MADSDYTLQMEDRGEYLFAVAAGERLTADISIAYWNEIAKKCFDIGLRKVLIEKDFPETVGPVEMVQMAEHLGRLLPGYKIAFHDRHGHASINELGKKLARNRDVMMQLFSYFDDAEKWLLAN